MAVCGLSASPAVFGARVDYTFVEVTQLTDLDSLTDMAVGRPMPGTNERPMAVVQAGRVLLCMVSEASIRVVAELEGFKNPAVSVAFADFTGDGNDDLWVGSAGPGSVYVYSLDDGFPFLAQTNRYMWSPVVKLLTPDLDGDGYADVVALTETGTVFAFLRRDDEFVQIWRSGSREGQVRHLLSCDLSANGRDEVILAREQGYIAVWRWTAYADEGVAAAPGSPLEQDLGIVDISHLSAAWRFRVSQEREEEPSRPIGQLEGVWEDYPWGQIHFVGALDVDRDGLLELVVTTSQNLLYAYGCAKSGHIVSKASVEIPHMSGLCAEYQPVSSTESAMLLGVQDNGLTLWRQRTDSSGWAFDAVWRSDFDLSLAQVVQVDSRLLFRTANAIRLFDRVPSDYVRVLVRGKPYLGLQASPIVVKDDVLLAAKDWADLFGLSLSWDQAQRRMTVLWGMQYLITTVDSHDVVVNGREVTLSQKPRNHGGLVFLPTELIRLLMPDVSWQPYTRVLTIR